MSRHLGTCHCGAVSFEVETDLSSPYRCNCRFCLRRGTVMHIVPAAAFHLHSGDETLIGYGEKDFAKHYFCGRCGIACFTRITRETPPAVSINVGCLEGIDPLQLNTSLFDGATRL